MNWTNYLSYLFGYITRICWPKPLNNLVLTVYCWIFKVDIEAAALPLSAYRSLSEFFTRELKDGERPLKGNLVMPVDGVMRSAERINSESSQFIKGQNFSMQELLATEDLAVFDQGFVYNLYLAPKDYHRIHSPCNATIKKITYLPGRLWPVNNLTFNYSPKLLARNERIVLWLESEWGKAALVLIGAFNVGCIELLFKDFKTNQLDSSISEQELVIDKEVQLGEALACFNFGSSVALVLEESFAGQLAESLPGSSSVLMGQVLPEETEGFIK